MRAKEALVDADAKAAARLVFANQNSLLRQRPTAGQGGQGSQGQGPILGSGPGEGLTCWRKVRRTVGCGAPPTKLSCILQYEYCAMEPSQGSTTGERPAIRNPVPWRAWDGAPVSAAKIGVEINPKHRVVTLQCPRLGSMFKRKHRWGPDVSSSSIQKAMGTPAMQPN